MPSEKLRRLGKVGSMVGFGLFIFAIVFYVSLPYGRFKDFLASQVSTSVVSLCASFASCWTCLRIALSVAVPSTVTRMVLYRLMG